MCEETNRELCDERIGLPKRLTANLFAWITGRLDPLFAYLFACRTDQENKLYFNSRFIEFFFWGGERGGVYRVFLAPFRSLAFYLHAHDNHAHAQTRVHDRCIMCVEVRLSFYMSYFSLFLNGNFMLPFNKRDLKQLSLQWSVPSCQGEFHLRFALLRILLGSRFTHYSAPIQINQMKARMNLRFAIDWKVSYFFAMFCWDEH